jgi:hypothetical protein
MAELTEATPIRGLPAARSQVAQRVDETVEFDAPVKPRRRGITSALLRSREGDDPRPTAPLWTVLVAALIGGGGAGTLGTSIFGSGGDVAEVRRDVDAHDARLDAHEAEIRRVNDAQASQLRWLADTLLVQSKAMAEIAETVGAKVDTAVPQYIAEGSR